MTLKKKILFWSLPTIFVAVGVFFAIFYSIPRLTYTYSDIYSGYLVSGSYGSQREYTVPAEYNGSKVVGVSTRAFYNSTKLESIIFEKEENIVYIGRLSFAECYNLRSISIRYAKEIDKNAFQNDSSLESLEIRATHILGGAFSGCKKLSSLSIGDGLETIGSYAFLECYSLKEVKLPKTVKHVYVGAFDYCGLEKLYVYKYMEDKTYINTLSFLEYYS